MNEPTTAEIQEQLADCKRHNNMQSGWLFDTYNNALTLLKRLKAVQDVVIGDGTTIICDISKADEGWAGICFAPNGRGVGVDIPEAHGKTDEDIGAFLRIRTDNPASLKVLIDKCTRALALLEEDKAPPRKLMSTGYPDE